MPTGPSRAAAAAVLVAVAVVGFGAGAILATDGAGDRGAAPPTASPEPGGSPTGEPAGGMTLTAEPTEVAADQQVRLTGRLASGDEGVTFQVQRSLDGGEWENFPVTATTRAEGAVDITVQSGRVGENRFRLTGEVDSQQVVSEEVAVTVG